MDTILQVKNLSYKYNKHKQILSNINFQLQSNKKLCIIGVNGSGKTTLLKTLVNLLNYDGEIFLNNRELRLYSNKDLAKKVALLSQVQNCNFPYTIWDTVALGRYPYIGNKFQKLGNYDKDLISENLNKLGLYEKKDKLISSLSGGQLQRVYLARVFVQDTNIILLDEPTNHLDLKYQIELVEYINNWVLEENKAIIGVFHDLNIVNNFADEVILLKEGSILNYGSKKEVITEENLINGYGINVFDYMKKSFTKW